jgi:hypothetical protein
MKIDITPETIAFLRNSNQWFDETTFTAVLETLTSIVIAQAPKWTNDVYSVLLLAGNEQFSIDQVQALWLLYFDTGYESRQIDNNLWLYGDSASVAYFSTPTIPLSDLPEVQNVLRNAEQKNASVLFFSKPGTQLGNDPLALAFASKLHYTALYGTPSIDKSIGSMVLQFTWTNFMKSDSIFTPQYTNNLTQNTILYLEGKNLLSTFWLTDTQFSLWFPLLLGQAVPWVDSLLSADQISALYEAFNKNLGIILNVTENTLWVWLHLRLGSPTAYESLIALQPMWRMLANWLMWSWTVTQSDTADSRTLSIDLPTGGGSEDALTTGDDMLASFSLPLISIAKDTATTTLSILPTDNEWTQLANDLLYHASSLMTFRYDPNPIMQMAGVNPIIGNLVGQIEILWTWAILGQLQLDSEKQQVIISFETK